MNSVRHFSSRRGLHSISRHLRFFACPFQNISLHWSSTCTSLRKNHKRILLPPLNLRLMSDVRSIQQLNITFALGNTPSISHNNENDHAHKVMQSLPEYTQSTISTDEMNYFLTIEESENIPPLPLDSNWENLQPNLILQHFAAFCKKTELGEVKLNNPSHTPLISAFVKILPSLSNQELKQILASLKVFTKFIHNPNVTNYNQLWKGLDTECVSRLPSMSMSEAYIFGDLFYQLRLSRISSYTQSMISNFSKKLPLMAPHEFVQFMFHLNLCRVPPKSVDPRKFETKLSKVINDISIDELGIISLGLFKTKTFIHTEDIRVQFLERLLASDLSNISSITMASILKILRKSTKMNHAPLLSNLLEKIKPRVQDLSIQAQLQLIIVGCESLVYHPEILQAVASNFVQKSGKLRLKEIERACLALFFFNFHHVSQPAVLSCFGNELRSKKRASELKTHPTSFFACTSYLAQMDFKQEDLISRALNPSFVQNLLEKSWAFDIGRQILELDYLVEIEMPHYTGHRLKPQVRKSMASKYLRFNRLPNEAEELDSSSLSTVEKMSLDTSIQLKALLGNQEALSFAHILPHYPIPDIVFCTDSNKNPVPVPEIFFSSPKNVTKRPLCGCHGDVNFNVVVIATTTQLLHGTSQVRGNVSVKLRQLRALGYSVCLVPVNKFQKMSSLDKQEHLEILLQREGCL